MSERCFVKVEFDPASSPGQMRRAVGGFLRYIQHRDLHTQAPTERAAPSVAGLIKYVAYRDKASSRAELFGPAGALATKGRKDFVEYVTRSIDGSQPQLFRTRAGELMDRRRAVSRFLFSPESAAGLNLERTARAAITRLESDMGVEGLQWIAAIHRNTGHHHVHLVLAGMHEVNGAYRRVDLPKRRLAAIKEAITLEIERQREERALLEEGRTPAVGAVLGGIAEAKPALKPLGLSPALIRIPPKTSPPAAAQRTLHHRREYRLVLPTSILRLRSAARRYQRQMEREADEQARRLGRERAA